MVFGSYHYQWFGADQRCWQNLKRRWGVCNLFYLNTQAILNALSKKGEYKYNQARLWLLAWCWLNILIIQNSPNQAPNPWIQIKHEIIQSFF